MRFFKLFSQFVIFSLILVLFSACRTIPIIAPSVHVTGHHHSGHSRRNHHYYYYPESEVYYDIGGHSYYYFSGGAWVYSAILPHRLKLHLGPHVSLELNTGRPYVQHHNHRRHYPRGYFKKRHKKGKWKKNKKRKNKKRRKIDLRPGHELKLLKGLPH